MCIIRNDFVHVSYRVGRQNGKPPGCDCVPVVVFALSLAGSGGLLVRIRAESGTTGASLRSGDGGSDQSEWVDEFYVRPGYYREHFAGLQVREVGVQKYASFRSRDVVAASESVKKATVMLEIEADGVVRSDEPAREELIDLLSCRFRDHVPVLFEQVV